MDWYNLYKTNWNGEIVPAAYQHPAKFARGLIRQIYSHLLEHGYLSPGDTVVDPFGGIAVGALDAMRHGLHWTGVELEEKFCILGTGMDCPGFDKAFWRRYQQRGDRWHELGVCPDCGALLDADRDDLPINYWFGKLSREVPSQIPHHWRGNIETWKGWGYPGTAVLLQGDSRELAEVVGQVEGVVSSPPYADAVQTGEGPGARHDPIHHRGENAFKQCSQPEYGKAEGQLGAMSEGETFWSAARIIVEQTHQVLKTGGAAVWVCKDFVRNGQRVPFSDRWRQLCESVGFEMVEWVRAWVIEEPPTMQPMIPDEFDAKRYRANGRRVAGAVIERKSFFRRQAERKGAPRIDNEDIIIMKK